MTRKKTKRYWLFENHPHDIEAGMAAFRESDDDLSKLKSMSNKNCQSHIFDSLEHLVICEREPFYSYCPILLDYKESEKDWNHDNPEKPEDY